MNFFCYREFDNNHRLFVMLKLVKVHTLQIKSLKLLFVFQADLQVSQLYVSLKQRVHQIVDCNHTAVDNLSCRVIHLDRLPLTWTKTMTV